ncbi:hypothetical protein I302_103146 [Kwoniella bestiolae CBS 10118]|uniref:Uncharacterized protein n=1 Tax=Kwoniella bestiolae CBS 10118 TaxID=1296100 RepID=A0AAJ8K568_9TREE
MPFLSTAILSLVFTLSSVVLAQDFPAGYTGCYTIDPSSPPTGLNPAEFNLPHDNRNQCIATFFQSEILAPHAFF